MSDPTIASVMRAVEAKIRETERVRHVRESARLLGEIVGVDAEWAQCWTYDDILWIDHHWNLMERWLW